MNRKERRTAAKQMRTAELTGASDKTIDMMIALAMTAADAKDWPKAEKALRQVLEVQPDHAEAHHQLGMTLARMGRASDGIEPLRRATQLKPREALYWQNLAVCCSAVAEYKDAASAARHAVEIDPSYGMAWDSLGDALMELRDFAGAKDAYERSLALKGQDIVTLKRLANCLMNAGNLPQAEGRLREILLATPDDPEVHANLGAVLLTADRPDQAVTHLGLAAERQPNNHMAAFNFGRALAATGATESAIRWLRRATSIEHRAAGPWQHLGQLLLEKGDLDEAYVAAKRAVDMAPGNAVIANLLRRVEASRAPIPNADKSVPAGKKPSPLMWDFHLGEEASAPPAQAPMPLDVVFVEAPAKGEPKAETKAKMSSDGVLDLTVLKIE